MKLTDPIPLVTVGYGRVHWGETALALKLFSLKGLKKIESNISDEVTKRNREESDGDSTKEIFFDLAVLVTERRRSNGDCCRCMSTSSLMAPLFHLRTRRV